MALATCVARSARRRRSLNLRAPSSGSLQRASAARTCGPTAESSQSPGRPQWGTLRALLDAGAVPISDPRGFHAVAVDARAPRFDGGIATRLDSVPFGIVVNMHG